MRFFGLLECAFTDFFKNFFLFSARTTPNYACRQSEKQRWECGAWHKVWKGKYIIS